MKKIYIIFTISFSFLNTYGQDFQSFKRIENNFTWIVPLDLEREFEALQQEVWEKGFDLGIACVTRVRKGNTRWDEEVEFFKAKGLLDTNASVPDTLTYWLESRVCLTSKEGVIQPYPKEWLEAIPDTLTKRLQKRGEELYSKVKNKNYFDVYALVKNTGEVLSVYFRVDSALLDVVQEKELQLIYDAAINQPFHPDCFDFNRPDGKLFMDTMDKYPEADSRVNREKRDSINKIRYKMLANAYDQKIPCVYGVLHFFSLKKGI